MARNTTKECSPGDLRKDLRLAVAGYLAEKEVILACYEVKSGGLSLADRLFDLVFADYTRPGDYFATVLTKQQVLSAMRLGGSSRSSVDVEALPLRNVLDVSESTKASDWHIVEVIGLGRRVSCCFATREAAGKFAAALRQAILEERGKTKSATSRSTATTESRLRELDELWRANLISKEEHQRKRKEILDSL